MNMITNRKSVRPYLLALVSGVLLLVSFPPFDLGYLAWVALIPLLSALAEMEFQKRKIWKLHYYRAQLLGLITGAAFYFGALFWLMNIFGILAVPLISIMVFYLFVFALVLSFLWARLRSAVAFIFAPAVLWVAIEYFKSEGWWGRFSWLNLGYTQHEFLPVLQFASIFGQYGISFLVVLCNSTIVFLIRSTRRACLPVSLAAAPVLLGLLLHGMISLNREYAPDIKVGLVQDENSELSIYEHLTQELADDVDFILWPEYAVPEFVEEEDHLLTRLSLLAAQREAYLIVGAKERSQTVSSEFRAAMMRRLGYPAEEIDLILRFYNTAYIFSPEGEIAGKYHKVNPIQFFLDGAAGKEFPSFDTRAGRIGVFICYDADYAYVARNIVRNGAEMLFIPTYDALGWGCAQHEQHSAMTSMRAVENRRFVARSTTSGISQVIDPNGRITSRIENGRSGVATGFIQAIQERSFYTRYGYLFPYFCILISMALILTAFFRRPALDSQAQEVLVRE